MINRLSSVASVLVLVAPVAGQSLVPPPRPPSSIVRELLQDEFRTDAERAALHRFHGTWDEEDLTTPEHRARIALRAWRLDDPVFEDPSVPDRIKAAAAMRRGDLDAALELTTTDASSPGLVLRASALRALGRDAEATLALQSALEATPSSVEEQVARVDAGRRLALGTGRTGAAYQQLMNTLARVRSEIDPLYWPAMLLEAELLFEKSRFNEAGQALWDVLELNPRCSDAWYLLGRLAVQIFDFDAAATAAASLRRIDPDHPLAVLLDAEMLLARREAVAARAELAPLLERFPNLPAARALELAAVTLLDDDAAITAAWDRWRSVMPGSPLAATRAGRLLSLHRQYDASRRWLETAIDIQPAEPAAHVELGLMLWQAGLDAEALEALERATVVDPFNLRAANSLELLREIMDYEVVRTEHFEIRFSPGSDEALVRDMPVALEAMHERIAGRFDWEPTQRTVVEVLPDHERFAVRVVGMPDVHTMAACTGPVIAMEVPRRSMPNRHMGRWDWQHVLEHEYTHTVTLERTRNRIPLWCTEGLAVSMEPAPRPWSVLQMVADEWRNGTMLDPDELDWAFVRPRRPQDRSLAYTQAWMMIEYLIEQYGESGLQRLLDQYRDGAAESLAFPAALGVSRDRFHEDFLGWAGDQVRAWGLDPDPSMEELARRALERGSIPATMMRQRRSAAVQEGMRRLLRDVGTPRAPGEPDQSMEADDWNLPRIADLYDPDPAQLVALLEAHPNHPDLLERAISDSLLRGRPMEERLPWLQTYVEVRPGDPFGHRLLADWYRQGATPERAIEHLRVLASFELDDPEPCRELAVALRRAGRFDEALEAIRRTISIDPYDASLREATASIAIEAGDLETARAMIEALLLLEPDQPIHRRRLDAVLKRMQSQP